MKTWNTHISIALLLVFALNALADNSTDTPVEIDPSAGARGLELFENSIYWWHDHSGLDGDTFSRIDTSFYTKAHSRTAVTGSPDGGMLPAGELLAFSSSDPYPNRGFPDNGDILVVSGSPQPSWNNQDSVTRDSANFYFVRDGVLKRKAAPPYHNNYDEGDAVNGYVNANSGQLVTFAADGASVVQGGRVWFHHSGVIYSLNVEGRRVRRTEFTTPGGGAVKKITLARPASNIPTSSLIMLTTDGRLYYQNRSLVPVPAPVLIASDVLDFAVREETLANANPALGLVTVYGVQDSAVVKWDPIAGASFLSTQGGPGSVIHSITLDLKNIYVSASGPSVYRAAWPKERAGQPGNPDWKLINSDGPVAVTNLRSDGEFIYWLRGGAIQALSTKAPAQELNIKAEGIEAVQVIQDRDNSIPLIAGRDAFVRCYARITVNTTKWPSASPAEGKLEISNGSFVASLSPVNNPLIGTADTPDAIVNLRKDPSLNQTFLFRVPAAMIHSGTTLMKFTVNDNNGAHETGATWHDDNISTASFNAVTKRVTDITLAPLDTDMGKFDPSERSQNLSLILSRAKNLLPISEFRLRFHPESITKPVVTILGIKQRSFTLPGDQEWALNWLTVAHALEVGPAGLVSPDLHWVGTAPKAVTNFNGLAGIGHRSWSEFTETPWPLRPFTGPLSALTEDSAVVRMSDVAEGAGNAWDLPRGGLAFAHELSHNYGRFHVPTDPNKGTAPLGPFDTLPYPKADFGYSDMTRNDSVFGFDALTPSPVPPVGTGDLMTYSSSRWPSRETYLADFNQIESGPAFAPSPGFAAVSNAAPAPPPDPAPGPVVLVQGHIDPAGRAAMFLPCYTLPAGTYDVARAAQMIANGAQLAAAYPLLLRMLAADGSTLSTTGVVLSPAGDDEGHDWSFMQFAALAPGTSRVQIVSNGAVIGERVFSAHAPVLSLASPVVANNRVQLAWTASDTDGDILSFSVQFSHDGGTQWQTIAPNLGEMGLLLDASLLVGGTDCRIRLLTSDGANTTVTTSNSFSLPKHAPTVSISGIRDGERLDYGGMHSLTANAYDAEDGSLGGDSLTWTLHDVARQTTRIGNGEQFSLTGLAPGAFTIDLDAVDSDGNHAQTRVAFSVLPFGIPEATEAPSIDGIAADAAYATSPVLRIEIAPGRYASARLAHFEGRLYVCITDLSYDVTQANVGLIFDLNSSGGTGPQSDDKGFFLSSNGQLSQRIGNGTTLVPDPDPSGQVLTAVLPQDLSWNAEFCIPDSLLEGWDHSTGLMVTHNVGSTPINWPAGSNANSPGTWSNAGLGAAPVPANVAPVAKAGQDQLMQRDEDATIILDGSASYDADGDPLTYSWTRVSGPNVKMEDTDTASPTVICPALSSVTTWVFQLSVSDGNFISTDQVSITVVPSVLQAIPPPGENWVVLTWPAGPDKTVVLQSSDDAVAWDDLGLFQTDFFSQVRYLEKRAPLSMGTRSYRLIAAPDAPPVGLLAHEPFVYPSGDPIAGKTGGTGWNGAWTYDPDHTNLALPPATNKASITLPSLDGAPIDDGAGLIDAPPANQFVSLTRQLTDPVGGSDTTMYFSCRIRPESGPGFAAGVRLKTENGAQIFFGRPGAGAADKYVIEDVGGAAQVTSGVNATEGDTALLIVKAEFGDAADKFTLFVNPDLSGGEPAAGQAVKIASLGMITQLGLFCGSACTVDDLRVSRIWSSATRDFAPVPKVETLAATEILPTSGTLHGLVNPSGGDTTAWFEYGTTLFYGNTTPLTPINVGSGSLYVPTASLATNLQPGTTYHFRLVAQNSRGITYGSRRTFTTSSATISQQLPVNPLDSPPYELQRTIDTLTGRVFHDHGFINAQTDDAGNFWTYVYNFEQPKNIIKKWSPQGALLWTATHTLNVYSTEGGFGSLVVDGAGNSYLGGTHFVSGSGVRFGTFVFQLVKFDPAGNKVWERDFGPTDAVTRYVRLMDQMTLDAGGNIIMAGTEGINGVNPAIVVVKCDANGNQLWVAQYNETNVAFSAVKLALDASGAPHVAANKSYFEDDANIPGPYDYRRLGVTALKYTSSGALAWNTEYDAFGGQGVNDLAVTVTGRTLLSVKSSSVLDNFGSDDVSKNYLLQLRSLNASGGLEWNVNCNAVSSLDTWVSTRLDADGSSYVFYYEIPFPEVNGDTPYLVNPKVKKFSPQGTLLWTRALDQQTNLTSTTYINFAVSAIINGNLLVSTAVKNPFQPVKARLASLSLTTGEDLWHTEVGTGSEHFVPYWILPCGDGFIMAGQTFKNPPSIIGIRFRPSGRANTLFATNIQATTATLRGAVNPLGVATTAHFEYGLTTSYGSTAPIPDQDMGAGNDFLLTTASISGLAPRTAYHYRIVGTTALGTITGQDLTFTTTAPFAAPLPQDDRFFTMKNQSLNIPISMLLANDAAGASALPFTLTGTSGNVRCESFILGDQVYVGPQFGFTGTASFNYTVNNGQGGTATAKVTINVKAPPVQPTITGAASLVMLKNTVSPWLNYRVGPDADAPRVTVTATSSNPAVIPVTGIDFDGGAVQRRIRLRPLCGQIGVANITLTATIGALSATTTFSVTVVDGPGAQSASIMGLGTLGVSEGRFSFNSSSAFDVSADGSVVTGQASSSQTQPFRWTENGGMTGLGALPGYYAMQGRAISADGSIIAGFTGFNDNDISFRWSSAGLYEQLPAAIFIQHMSGDASVLVGYRKDYGPLGDLTPHAVKWTTVGGVIDLPQRTGDTDVKAYGISSDGSIIVGYAINETTGASSALAWQTSGGGPVTLPALTGAGSCIAYAASADGSIIVGECDSGDEPSIPKAVRWTRTAPGVYAIEQLAGTPVGTYSTARAVSADGSVITGLSGFQAMIWDATHGVRDLRTTLIDAGLELTDWDTLQDATAVSANGRVVVGYGSHNFKTEAFRILLPQGPQAPGISLIADQIVDRNTPTAALPVTVSDPDTNPDCQTYTLASSNTALFPVANVVINGTGNARSITATPTADVIGSSLITLTVDDGFSSVSVSFTITVQDTNLPPVALDGSFSTNEDTAYNGTLHGNDPDGEPLTFRIFVNLLGPLGLPQHGSLTNLNATTGTFTYTPDHDYSGGDRILFRVLDPSSGLTNIATVAITVIPVNDAPVADNLNFTTPEDTVLQNVFLTGNDPEGGVLKFFPIDEPSHGVLSLQDNGNFSYTPAANFNGNDTFTYCIRDDAGAYSAPAAVNIIVTPVNDSPDALDGNFTTDEDTPHSGVLPGSDVDGDTLSFGIFTFGGVPIGLPQHGNLDLNPATGAFIYTPNINYNGEDYFQYRVYDATSGSRVAIIHIVITPVNDPPVANSLSFTTRINTTLGNQFVTGNDVEGSALEFFVISQPSHGQLTLNKDTGAFSYIPADNFFGNDSFTYRCRDTDGAYSVLASTTLTVTLDGRFTTAEDTPYSGALLTIPQAGKAFAFGIYSVQSLGPIGLPEHGKLSLNSVTGSFTYLPDADYNGQDQIRFFIRDIASGTIYQATIAITVTPVNDPPVADELDFVTTKNVALNGTAVSGHDVEGDVIQFQTAVSPSHGTLSLQANGSFTYTPANNYLGNDSFTYRVFDGVAYSSIATVNITINNTNSQDVIVSICYRGRTILVPSYLVNRYLAKGATSGACSAGGGIAPGFTTQPHSLAGDLGGSITFTSVASGNPQPTYRWYFNGISINGATSASYTIANIQLNHAGSYTVVATNPSGWATSNVATLAINGAAMNRGVPQVANLNISGNQGQIITGFVIASNPDGDPVAFTKVSEPAHGSVFLNAATGAISYVAADGFHGVDTFACHASNSQGDSNVATVIVRAIGNSGNDVPAAVPQILALAKNTAKTFTLTGASISNSPLAFTIVSLPAHGVLVANGNASYTFTPGTNFVGTDGFTFTSSDGNATSDPAGITFNVLDTDSMSAWRVSNFGSSNKLGYAAALANPDSDAFTNLEEFAFGLDPRNGSVARITYGENNGILTERGAPIPVFIGPPGNLQPYAVFCRRVDWQAAGLTYTVVFSADLMTKVPSIAMPTILATDGEYEVVAVPYPTGILVEGQEQIPQFFQVKVTGAL